MAKRCYIFDIDGTLADCSHRLHHIQKKPKDWRSFFAACGDDAPIPHMIELAKRLWATMPIVFVSGRSDECQFATLSWLEAQGFKRVGAGSFYSFDLYMRKAGDYRDDNILKGVLLDQMLADGWEPIMAFDDRTRVVKAWRSRGIPCAQVAEGDF